MNEEFKKINDVYWVPLHLVREIETPLEFGGEIFGANLRHNNRYGDIDSLADFINNNGIPGICIGFKKDGFFYLTDGHRRTRAARVAEKKYGKTFEIPIRFDREISEEKRVCDMIVSNEGMRLSVVEQAEGILRLEQLGTPIYTICKKTGFGPEYIEKLKVLAKAPQQIKDMVLNDLVGANFAIDLMRKEKDFDRCIELLQSAIESQRANGVKKIRVTPGNIGTKVADSFGAVKKAFKKAGTQGMYVRPEKIELYNFLQQAIDGKYDTDYFLNELFEPAPEGGNENT